MRVEDIILGVLLITREVAMTGQVLVGAGRIEARIEMGLALIRETDLTMGPGRTRNRVFRQ